MVPSADVADDIIQETFLCLGVTKKQAEQIKNPRAYILGTALHRIQHRSRDASVRARHEEEASRLRSRLHPAAADEVIAKENFLRLHKALDSLPAPLRLAMHLRCVEGLSYREISAVTGLSVNAVSVQIYRGRKKLKSLLGESQLTLALLKLKELGPDAWFLEPSRRKLPA